MSAKVMEMSVKLPAATVKALRNVFGYSHLRGEADPPVGTMSFKSYRNGPLEAFEVFVHTPKGCLIVADVEQQWMAEAIIKAAAARPRKAKGK